MPRQTRNTDSLGQVWLNWLIKLDWRRRQNDRRAGGDWAARCIAGHGLGQIADLSGSIDWLAGTLDEPAAR